MGKITRTFTKAIKLYFEKGMGFKSIGKELGIAQCIVYRWINHYKNEGIQGLEEKRGKAKGPRGRFPADGHGPSRSDRSHGARRHGKFRYGVLID